MEGQQACVYGGDGCGELQVSVSFGRFDKDSLSWEKWSSFSPNKYLEEVEKCSTPGSVARKAAYFEAHYRRVAARKAELLLLASSSSSSSIGTDGNGALASSREVLEEGYRSICQQQEEEEEEEQNEDDMITLEKERLSFEVVLGESTAGRVADPFDRSVEEKDEGSSVKDDLKEEEEEIPAASGLDAADAAKRSGNGREEAADSEFSSENVEIKSAARLEMSARIREDTAKLESWRKPHKTDLLHKEKIMVKAKKKPAPTIIKSPQVYSTPRTSKPTSISPAPSMTKSLRNPGIDVPTKRSKSGPALDLKKVSPNVVCRPTSSNTPSFDPTAIAVPRRSLIMERMGDKDIIKRAFKTFQNHVGLSKSFYGERSSAQKSAPFAVTGDTSSTDIQKENMGLKAGTAIKKSTEVLPSPYASRSNERAEKRIQINKKPEQKFNVKEAEKSRLQSKSKEQRERDVKRLTQNIGFKATPMPAFYRGQNKPVSNQRKMVNKKEIQG